MSAACPDAGGDRGVRHRRRHPGAPQLRRRRGVPVDRVRTARVHRDAGHLDPISAYVDVDFQLPGCPIDKGQLLEVLAATLQGRPPNVPAHSVCHQCKARGVTCVMVADGTPCLGPVTQAGCGALCPAVGRGCYGCFGPMESPNTDSLTARLTALGMSEADIARVYLTFNANAPEFAAAGAAAQSEGAADEPSQ